LLSAPLANIRTKLANRIRETTLPSHRLSAEQANVDALAAAVWTIVVAFHVDHRVETLFAGNCAALASFDAFVVRTH
jgi:hypothetical protein